MQKFLINNILFYLLKLRKKYKRILNIGIDALILPLVIFFSFWIYSDKDVFQFIKSDIFWIIPTTLILGITVFLITGQYRSLSRYLDSKAIYYLLLRNSFLIISIILIGKVFGLTLLNFKNWLIFWLILNCFTAFLRLVLRDLQLLVDNSNIKNKKKIMIYGAGEAGAKLSNSLRYSKQWQIISFFDDDPKLWGRSLHGKVINSPRTLKTIKKDCDLVCLAIPSLSNKRKEEIVSEIQNENINILEVPSISDIISGKSSINELKKINIEDLLKRELVAPDLSLLRLSVKNKVICITGGAGSIGSELFFQSIKFSPNKILLIDNSEINVYKIQQRISKKNLDNNKVKVILGDISQPLFLDNLFKKEKVDIIFHAAAYKHVPLVEENPLSGIRNNVISSKLVCESASKNRIKNVVLISTDKAVRPTNIMGASKRLSELIFQTYAFKEKSIAKIKNKVCYSIVRFGNVLNSSGSVVPLFKKQIKEGGPVTITHKNVVRYFMSIEEASQLVIQTISLSKGGDIFLLDMGKPKKIEDLARQMISLQGLKIKNKDNPEGDIEIIYSGLRKGEKLYEELLIDGKSSPTKHPLIFKAKEKLSDPNKILLKIEVLNKKCIQHDENGALHLLDELVPEWEWNQKH